MLTLERKKSLNNYYLNFSSALFLSATLSLVLGKMMQYITDGMDGNEALKKATGRYGRYDEADEYIVPRKQ